MNYNIVRREKPYNFKNIKCTSEAVFLNGYSVNLYESQNCRNCGYCSIGYYKYIRDPQNFKCTKCNYEWSIAVENGVNNRMDEIEDILYKIDRDIEKLKKLGALR